MLPRQELADHVADDRRAAQAAADETPKPTSPFVHRDAVQRRCRAQRRGAVVLRAVDGDLEFARQKGEFRMEGRPLADQFAIRPRIDDFVGGDAGEMVGGDVADAIAAGLDRVHLHRREVGQDVRHVLELAAS